MVVADTDTERTGQGRAERGDGLVRRGPIFGRLPITPTATFPMTNPASVTRRAVSVSSATPDAQPTRAVTCRNERRDHRSGRGQQGITGRVGGGVPIGMPGQPGLPWPLKPRQMHRAPVLERMHIHPKPDPRQFSTGAPYRWRPGLRCGGDRRSPNGMDVPVA